MALYVSRVLSKYVSEEAIKPEKNIKRRYRTLAYVKQQPSGEIKWNQVMNQF
jgi:hypothetical protein